VISLKNEYKINNYTQTSFIPACYLK
jgi:hypothetical protein